MLIEIQVKFKLAIQCILSIFRRVKQFTDIILREQGTAQYPHDLYDWTSQFKVVFDDSDKTVYDATCKGQSLWNPLRRICHAVQTLV